MREIKFRGKTINDNKWVYGDFIHTGNRYYIQPPNSMGIDPETGWFSIVMIPVKQETIGQFTGFYDKNGKEIYEGDIVRDKTFNYKTKKPQTKWRIFVVHWDTETASFWQKLVKSPDTSERLGSFYAAEKECEVVGNIYENSELINES